MPLPIPLLPRKHGSLNHFQESSMESLENHPENHYLKIAILWADMASAVASLNDLKIFLEYLHKPIVPCDVIQKRERKNRRRKKHLKSYFPFLLSFPYWMTSHGTLGFVEYHKHFRWWPEIWWRLFLHCATISPWLH